MTKPSFLSFKQLFRGSSNHKRERDERHRNYFFINRHCFYLIFLIESRLYYYYYWLEMSSHDHFIVYNCLLHHIEQNEKAFYLDQNSYRSE